MAGSSHSQAKERSDVQAAIAKAVELRSLHAALLQRSNLGSPAVLGPRLGASPSVSRRSAPPSAAAEDYPVFTPSHEEPSKGYIHVHPEHCNLPATWRSIKVAGEGVDAVNIDHMRERNICAKTEHLSKQSSCISHNSLQSSLLADALNFSSSRTSPGDHESYTTCNSRKPAAISRRSESEHRSRKTLTRIASSHDSEAAIHARAKHRGPILSWLFRTAKKKKNELEMSSNPIRSEEMSQFFTDWGLLSLESVKMELLEANKERDSALIEVSEMRSSFGEMQRKLASLETYCEELKKALKQAKSSQVYDRLNLSKRSRINVCIKDNLQVTQAAMVEGFLQMVSESRLSVKQFCSMLIHQIEATDCNLKEKLDLLLQQQQMASCDKHPKATAHHIEALVNKSLFQDFENCVFQKNGAPTFLDQQRDRSENFSAFVALRSLSWNQVLRKGTKFYSEDFSRFCDQKMSCIVTLLACSSTWPERLLQCFFVAAKCVWLLHLLAFSFSPPLTILRVDEDRKFDPLYMEEIILEKKKVEETPAQVRVMVMPGFYIQDSSVLKCRVLCRYLPAA